MFKSILVCRFCCPCAAGCAGAAPCAAACTAGPHQACHSQWTGLCMHTSHVLMLSVTAASASRVPACAARPQL